MSEDLNVFESLNKLSSLFDDEFECEVRFIKSQRGFRMRVSVITDKDIYSHEIGRPFAPEFFDRVSEVLERHITEVEK